ncbi:hypothetical protein Mapa_013948 [Marchantia paleacea]|nr:hypothetical protein Mapa_013948 [Marchantia paleacea]
MAFLYSPRDVPSRSLEASIYPSLSGPKDIAPAPSRWLGLPCTQALFVAAGGVWPLLSLLLLKLA